MEWYSALLLYYMQYVYMNTIRLTTENHAEVIEQAMAVLADGGLIIYPTETCYGIGADATNQEAIDKLLAYKTKRSDKALSVAVTGIEMAEQYVEINDTARRVYQNFLPGPITVVSKSLGKLADNVASSMGTQGIRVPDFPLIRDLVAAYGKPVTSTSANASYKKTPYTIDDILHNIGDKQKALLDLIIDAGELPRRKPSTVIDTTLDNIHIVRQGSLDLSDEDANVFQAESLEDTGSLAEKILYTVREHLGHRAIVFLLQGELGAGKTHFTKEIAKRIGVEGIVKSPTYTICQQYEGEVTCITEGEFNQVPTQLHHMDTYRFYEAQELDDLRPEEIFAAPNVVVIEWANKVHEHAQQYMNDAVVVKMEITVPKDAVKAMETGLADGDAEKRRFAYEIIQPAKDSEK